MEKSLQVGRVYVNSRNRQQQTGREREIPKEVIVFADNVISNRTQVTYDRLFKEGLQHTQRQSIASRPLENDKNGWQQQRRPMPPAQAMVERSNPFQSPSTNATFAKSTCSKIENTDKKLAAMPAAAAEWKANERRVAQSDTVSKSTKTRYGTTATTEQPPMDTTAWLKINFCGPLAVEKSFSHLKVSNSGNFSNKTSEVNDNYNEEILAHWDADGFLVGPKQASSTKTEQLANDFQPAVPNSKFSDAKAESSENVIDRQQPHSNAMQSNRQFIRNNDNVGNGSNYLNGSNNVYYHQDNMANVVLPPSCNANALLPVTGAMIRPINSELHRHQQPMAVMLMMLQPAAFGNFAANANNSAQTLFPYCNNMPIGDGGNHGNQMFSQNLGLLPAAAVAHPVQVFPVLPNVYNALQPPFPTTFSQPPPLLPMSSSALIQSQQPQRIIQQNVFEPNFTTI